MSAQLPDIRNGEARFLLFETIRHFFYALYKPDELRQLIQAGGPTLVCTIIFIETGLFAGFFLPGDSLLVTAGILAAGGFLPLKWLLGPGILCAIAGDQLGYWIGRGAGSALYKREDSFFFRRSHLQRAHEFYEKYGGRAVIFARFVPIVRTFCPPVAGAAGMPYSRYLSYDLFGGIFWVGTMILGGYFLGRSIPNIGQKIHYVIAVVVVLSLLPVVIGFFRAKSSGNAAAQPSISPSENN